MAGACRIVLARLPVHLVRTVLCDDQVVGNHKRLRISVDIDLRVVRQSAEPCHIVAVLVVVVIGHARQILVTRQEGRPPRDVADLLSVLAHIPVDHLDAVATDAAEDHQHVRIAFQPFEGCLHLFRLVDPVDVAHGESRPSLHIRLAVAVPFVNDGYAKGRHQFLLDRLVGGLLAHVLHHHPEVLRLPPDILIIPDESHNLLEGLQRAHVRSRILEERHL